MLKTTFRKFFELLFVLWGISTLVFFLQRLIPGSPADMVLGFDASDVEKNAWLAKYGFNQTLLQQYFVFFKQLITLNLGNSYADYQPISTIIYPRFLITLRLASISFIFSVLLGLTIGLVSALYEGKIIDKMAAFFSLLAISAPSFVIGPLLIWVFSVKLQMVPLMEDASISSYILPAFTLGVPLAAFSGRMIRSGLIDTMQEDYIRTARSKGLSRHAVLMKHALQNALLPTLTIFGLQLGVLLSGTLITEQIFNWPGMGSLVVEAVQAREYNIVSGCVIIMATLYVGCNFIVDILYQAFDPRVRVQ
jgi:ABC-type dipeptide/oligopeptide/nickel transport system permease component